MWKWKKKTCVLTLLVIVGQWCILAGIFGSFRFGIQFKELHITNRMESKVFLNETTVIPTILDTCISSEPEMEGLEICPENPNTLVGKTVIDESIDLHQFSKEHPEIQPGGWWKPRDCKARSRVAFVIPFRDRWKTLRVLLPQLHLVLQRQKIHYRIFLSEQSGNETFNKGRIMNAAFLESQKIFNFDCVTFHDADLIPENDRNLYVCPYMPRHMSVLVSTLNYTGFYNLLIGGVLEMNISHFRDVNGYSNEYWGWGGEDDDIAFRIENSGYHFIRPPREIGRYFMVEHKKAYRNPQRFRRLGLAKKRQHIDGLNNVKYKLLRTTNEPLYTHLLLDIGIQGAPIIYKGKPCYPWEKCNL